MRTPGAAAYIPYDPPSRVTPYAVLAYEHDGRHFSDGDDADDEMHASQVPRATWHAGVPDHARPAHALAPSRSDLFAAVPLDPHVHFP
jgi:hypothetical protein